MNSMYANASTMLDFDQYCKYVNLTTGMIDDTYIDVWILALLQLNK